MLFPAVPATGSVNGSYTFRTHQHGYFIFEHSWKELSLLIDCPAATCFIFIIQTSRKIKLFTNLFYQTKATKAGDVLVLPQKKH